MLAGKRSHEFLCSQDDYVILAAIFSKWRMLSSICLIISEIIKLRYKIQLHSIYIELASRILLLTIYALSVLQVHRTLILDQYIMECNFQLRQPKMDRFRKSRLIQITMYLYRKRTIVFIWHGVVAAIHLQLDIQLLFMNSRMINWKPVRLVAKILVLICRGGK